MGMIAWMEIVWEDFAGSSDPRHYAATLLRRARCPTQANVRLGRSTCRSSRPWRFIVSFRRNMRRSLEVMSPSSFAPRSRRVLHLSGIGSVSAPTLARPRKRCAQD